MQRFRHMKYQKTLTVIPKINAAAHSPSDIKDAAIVQLDRTPGYELGDVGSNPPSGT